MITNRVNYSGYLLVISILFSLSSLVFLAGCPTTQPEVIRMKPDEESILNKEIKKILAGKPTYNPIYLESNVSELGFVAPIQGSILENNGTEGITIKATEGQAVRAVRSGIVTFVSEDVSGLGKTITIKHSDGFLSVYSYNSEILVKKNQTVKQGDTIAKAGKTGRATQTSLNFRLFKNDTPVNPLNYLP